MKRRHLIGWHVFIVVGALFTLWRADATPTPRQVRQAVDPAFVVRRDAGLAWLGVALAADVVATRDGLARGCHESNPIYGSHPSTGALVATHALVLGGATIAYDGPARPTWPLGVAGALFAAAALHNSRCGR